MMPKPTSAADAQVRASSSSRSTIIWRARWIARAALSSARFPGSISHSTPPPNGTIPRRLQRCLASIAKADIIVATMLFMEEHAQAVLPAIQARRDTCDAMLGCMSAPKIVKLTRIGRFNMDGSKRGALDFLKRLRGGGKPSAHRRRAAARDAAPDSADPPLHSGPRPGSARLFPDAAILARRLGRERRQSRPLPGQPLRRRRQCAACAAS